jgi:hypothetical protein
VPWRVVEAPGTHAAQWHQLSVRARHHKLCALSWRPRARTPHRAHLLPPACSAHCFDSASALRRLRFSLRASSLQGRTTSPKSQSPMAALGTAITPAAATTAPCCYNRHPRSHITARRNRVASARRLDLCASSSPAVTAPDIPDEALVVSSPDPPRRAEAFRRAGGEPAHSEVHTLR